MIIVSINQPAYLPWLGYFHRIACSDIHIVLDHVQFEKNSFVNRNKIRTKRGWCWLTVPLRTKGLFGNLAINTLEISDNIKWKKKHWASIITNYSKAEYFDEYSWVLKDVYSKNWTRFNELAKVITTNILKALNIKKQFLYSSNMEADGKKDELVLNLCKEVGATIYLSGPLGRHYLKEEIFLKYGIRIVYHDFVHPSYPQVYSGFEPYMSVIDLLFNCGPESLSIMGRNQKEVF